MDTEIVLVAASTVFIFFLLLFLFGFVLKYQRRALSFVKEKELIQSKFEQTLLQSQIEVQEATFSLLGKELHDNIGQLLSTAKMLLGIAELNLVHPPDTLVTANATVGKAINELRALSKSLNKEWLEKFDLIGNLTAEVARINAAAVVKTSLVCADELSMEADKQIVLFRIIQEAMQNALKHAAAGHININISQSNREIIAIVQDDGTGFSSEGETGGVGMINMVNRARQLGGKVEWQSNGEGSVVTITIPLKTELHEDFNRNSR